MLEHPHLKWLGIRSVVIPNGIPALEFEADAFKRECPEASQNCRDRFKIVSIGRLSPEKGCDLLIRAMARLTARGIDATLVVVGEGPEKEKLIRQVGEERVSDRVHFVGYRDRAYRYLPFFDVFALPSYTEGLPITLLEAMQARIPIVATSVGEVPEVLGGGKFGYLVQSGNHLEMADKIEGVYWGREKAETKALAAREKALTEYGVDKMANRYYELYKELLSK
jgi:glycosyltransferase involved in cell wall biosynthesis